MATYLEAWDFICKRQKHLITRQVFFHYDSVADLHALAKKFGFRVIAKDGKLTIGGGHVHDHSNCTACLDCEVCKWQVTEISCSGHGTNTKLSLQDSASSLLRLLRKTHPAMILVDKYGKEHSTKLDVF